MCISIGHRVVVCAIAILAVAGRADGQDSPKNSDRFFNDQWYLETDEGELRLYVKEVGKGDPVVVLHGGFGAEHGYMLDLIAPHTQTRRFVLYDQRGSLRSPAESESISFKKHIADLETLRKELRLESMTLLAHSAGTLLAMAYFEAHPKRVSDMVFIAPVKAQSAAAKTDEGELVSKPFDTAAWAQRDEFWEMMRSNGLVETNRKQLRPNLTDRQKTHAWRISYAAANLFHLEKWNEMKGGQVFYSAAAASATSKTMPRDYNYLSVIAERKTPVVVIQGDYDISDWKGAYWKWAASKTPNIDYRGLEKTGHNAWVDSADPIKKILSEVL